MKAPLSARLLRKFQQTPTRLTAPMIHYLRSGAFSQAPRPAAETNAYQAMINECTEVMQRMHDLKELSPWMELFQVASDDYMPSYPPVSPITTSFFQTTFYFDVLGGLGHEIFGGIFLELARAFQMHPERLLVLGDLYLSRMGIYLHQGFQGKWIQLLDLATGESCSVEFTSGYRGTRDELWFVRIAPPLQPGEGSHALTTPYVMDAGARADWQEYLLRHPDPLHFKIPKPCNYWLEFALEGYVGHTDQAIFLQGLPDRPKTRPHSPQYQSPASVYSFAQRWLPFVVQAKPAAPVRARCLALVDEREDLVCAIEPVDGKQTPAQILNWLRKVLKKPQPPVKPGYPKELWVDDPALQAYLSEHFLQVTCKLRPGLPRLEVALQEFTSSVAHQEQSLLELLGAQEATRFYQLALEFFEARPWHRISNHSVLEYRDADGYEWGLVIAGSDGREFGLALYSSPSEARNSKSLPLLGLGFVPAWIVAAPDLNFIEREQLAFRDNLFPWAMNCPGGRQTVSPEQIEELAWLMKRVPAFLHNLKPLAEGGRRLQGPIDPIPGLPGVAELLIALWQKDTQHAWRLASVLERFLHKKFEGAPPSPEDFNLTVNVLAAIGMDYLRRYSRKRNLVLNYLANPPVPNFSGHPTLARTAPAITAELATYMECALSE